MKKGEDFSGFVGALDSLNIAHRLLRFIPGPAIIGTGITAVAVLMRCSDMRALLVCPGRST